MAKKSNITRTKYYQFSRNPYFSPRLIAQPFCFTIVPLCTSVSKSFSRQKKRRNYAGHFSFSEVFKIKFVNWKLKLQEIRNQSSFQNNLVKEFTFCRLSIIMKDLHNLACFFAYFFYIATTGEVAPILLLFSIGKLLEFFSQSSWQNHDIAIDRQPLTGPFVTSLATTRSSFRRV